MTSNLSLYETNLTFYFVVEDENALSDEFVFGRKKLSENVLQKNLIDISPAECIELAKRSTKCDIFIFEEFEGEAFQKVSETKSLVLGTRCLISCLIDNVAVPNTGSPIFTMSMRGLIISMSSISVSEKKSLEKLVNYMGGRCIPQLTDHVTHLVTNNVMTKKYEQAALSGQSIMKPEWVIEAWNKSREDNILATDSQFDEYRCPVFYNLGITSTGLNIKIRAQVKSQVEANGGVYHGGYSSSIVNVLIAERTQNQSEKLKAAIQDKKECLTPEWIFHSVKKGFALPIMEYKIELQARMLSSTPQKSGLLNAANMSDISCIPAMQSVNETGLTNISTMSNIIATLPTTMAMKPEPSYKAVLDSLNLNEAKKAGPFLDGCNIFVCGFSTEEKDKIYKILNCGGACRFEIIKINVSHVIIGMPLKKDIDFLNAKKTDAVYVTLDWLAESIKQKQPVVNCDPYLYILNPPKSKGNAEEVTDAPSPASKKNILSMTGNFKVPKPKRLEFQNDEQQKNANQSVFNLQKDASNDENLENLLLDQYLQADTTVRNKENSIRDETLKEPKDPEKSSFTESESQYTYEHSEEINFLTNLTVHIRGFDEESSELLIQDSRAAGANVILDENYQGVVDYLVVSLDIVTLENIRIKAKNVVNQNWLINAKKNNKIIDILYYYKPIIFPEDLKPLGNMVIVLSVYSGDERQFLVQLAAIMGAEFQDSYKRANKPVLICPTPTTPKYNAAIKWGLPIVSCEWLLECYRREKRMSLKDYLVGDSILPIDDVLPDAINQPSIEPVEHGEELMQLDEIEEGARALVARAAVADAVDEDYATPKNKRLDALRRDNLPTTSPKTKRQRAETDEMLLNCLDTPTREYVREVFKNAPPDTPNTRWLRRTGGALPTPEIPECSKTPFREKQKAAHWDEQRKLSEWAEDEYNRTRKPSTPWTEYKKKFWKDALGDQYESPSQCYNENTQYFKFCDDNMQKRIREQEQAEDFELDENIKKLSEFINNRPGIDQENDDKMNMLPETAPTMTDMEIPSTQPEERVGWREPSDISLVTPRRPTNAMKYRGTPVFSISCSPDEMKIKILDQIKGLGGRICENILNYDRSCTHLVCEKPNRGEKIFGCIAAGKWVLCLDYIRDSVDAGHFLNEELYEWGNPKALKLPQLTPNEGELAAAVHRCRSTLQTDPADIPATGIFKDFKVILRLSKFENFKNLIEAGGGKVVVVDEPYHARMESLKGVTHFISQALLKPVLSTEDKDALKKANIVCVNVKFLNACITSSKPPNPANFPFK